MDGDWPLDFRSLRYFASVAEQKSFSGASARLHIAQPALSRQIRRLEEELGVELFTRHARGVDLTEAGEILLNRVYTIFRQVEQTRDDVTTHAQFPYGTVTVGLPPTAGEFISPLLAERVRDRYPSIELRLVEGFSGELYQKLMNHEISLAVMHNPIPHQELKTSELLVEHLCLVGPAGSLTKKRYRLAQAAALPLVLPNRPNHLRILIDDYAERCATPLNVAFHSDGVGITKALVRRGLGYTILTFGAVFSEVEQGKLDAVPISNPAITWPMGVAMRRDQSRKRTFIVIEELIRDVVADLLKQGIWR